MYVLRYITKGVFLMLERTHTRTQNEKCAILRDV